MIGIYLLKNKLNNKCYVGQSIYIEDRIKQHFRNATNPNTHTFECPLYRAIRKYGRESFEIVILEETTLEDLTIKEQYWMDTYDTHRNGYNIVPAIDSKKGENCNFAVLTDEQADEIRFLLKTTNIPMKNIAAKYSVSGSAVEDINKGYRRVISSEDYPLRKNAKSIGKTGENSANAKLTNEDVLTIRKRYVNEELLVIFQDYSDKISFSGFKKVVYGSTYKNIPVYKKREKKWIMNN